MTTTEGTMPRIYVACLAAYNNGKLHGEWIDADMDADMIEDAVQEMLAKSPIPTAEEWAIHDHDGFGGIKIGEYESFERVAKLADFFAIATNEQHQAGSLVREIDRAKADLLGALPRECLAIVVGDVKALEVDALGVRGLQGIKPRQDLFAVPAPVRVHEDRVGLA